MPDEEEVVVSRADAVRLKSRPLLIVDLITEFMDSHDLGSGPPSLSRIGDGQSNITYRIQRGHDVFVLRRGPRPPLPKSAHDMVREARIQQLVRRSGVQVPEILAICEDSAVLGVPFYIMSFVEGTIITDRIPAHLDSQEQRRATSEAIVDALVQIHQVDVTSELATLGRPEGYLNRQVDRFAGLWDTNSTRTLPDVARIGDWLARNVPDTQMAALIHGDYRAGNLLYASQAPAQIVAVLDWEMATIGDPLADLGYLTATYAEPGCFSTPLELTPVTREPGYLDRCQLISRYGEQMDLDMEALPWYQTLALWKAAVFCEGIYARWRRGERPHDTHFGPALKEGVPRLLAGARHAAGMM